MTRDEYFKAKAVHAKEKVDRIKQRRHNRKKSPSRGAEVTGGPLSPVSSGITTGGTPGGSMPTP